jgi:hypothetical protein
MAKPLIITPENSECNREGNNSLVYLVGDKAIKVPRVYNNPAFTRRELFTRLIGVGEMLKKEYEIQEAIYDAGYPVPKPYGIFPVATSGGRDFYVKKKQNGFFMERVHGEDLWSDPESRSAKMNEASDIVKSINENLGIMIGGKYQLYPRNVLYNKKNSRIVLIDFGNWMRVA